MSASTTRWRLTLIVLLVLLCIESEIFDLVVLSYCRLINLLMLLQILYGAVVAGPDKQDTFLDVRTQKKFTGVSLDTNAGVQSSLAALYSLQKTGLLNGAARPSSLISRLPGMVLFVLLGQAIFNKLCNF